MGYKNFKVEDLVQDPWFRAWVDENDPDASLFWKKWLLNNPKEQDKVEQARQILKSLSYLDDPMPIDRKKDVWNAIKANTSKPHALPKYPLKKRGNKNGILWIKAISKLAATILVFLAAIYVFSAIRDSINENKMIKIIYLKRKPTKVKESGSTFLMAAWFI